VILGVTVTAATDKHAEVTSSEVAGAFDS